MGGWADAPGDPPARVKQAHEQEVRCAVGLWGPGVSSPHPWDIPEAPQGRKALKSLRKEKTKTKKTPYIYIYIYL